jgi:hypothetical protein
MRSLSPKSEPGPIYTKFKEVDAFFHEHLGMYVPAPALERHGYEPRMYGIDGIWSSAKTDTTFLTLRSMLIPYNTY